MVAGFMNIVAAEVEPGAAAPAKAIPLNTVLCEELMKPPAIACIEISDTEAASASRNMPFMKTTPHP